MLQKGTGRLPAALRDRWTPEVRRTVLLVLISTAVCSFLAHGFLFANEFFSHDSLSYYYSFNPWSVAYYTGLGRFGIPFYELIKGDLASPWLIGFLFLFWMVLTALLVVRLLDLRTTGSVILTSALLCTNLAMTLTGATYVYCLDEYAFSLFTAVAAVCLFRRGRWWTIPGLILLVVSLSVYQAYFTVAVSLCLLAVIKQLIENEPWVRTIRTGVRYLASLAAGFVLYYGLWSILCAALSTEKARTEDSVLSNLGALPGLIWKANMSYIKALLFGDGVLNGLMAVVHVLILLLLLWRLLAILRDREVPVGSKVLLVLLTCLIPTAFNASQILFPSAATRLTAFSWELLYVLLLMCREPHFRRPWGTGLRAAAALLLCCVLWHHMVYANQVYMKKDLEKSATLSLVTRLIDRVELTEGYLPGETPVALVGELYQNTYLNQGRTGFERLTGTVGLHSDYAATYNLGFYLTTYLNYPLLLDTQTDYSQNEEVQAMPCFPAADAIQMIDGTVVVKLS